jgi:hypothetical protein
MTNNYKRTNRISNQIWGFKIYSSLIFSKEGNKRRKIKEEEEEESISKYSLADDDDDE